MYSDSPSLMVDISTALPTSASGRPLVGSTSLTSEQSEFLLGTLLGDGCMQWTGARYGRFRANHGGKQEAYCRHKYEVLHGLVTTPPKTMANQGYGETSCYFNTVTSPAFESVRSLCYRVDPVSQRLKKTVTPGWCAALTWRSLAYWYMDDGGLSEGRANLATHGFPREQVELLISRLQALGVDARLHHMNRQGKTYWFIGLGIDATHMFLENIRPFAVPSMLYKWEARPIPQAMCVYCGATFRAHSNQGISAQPHCSSESCLARYAEYLKSYRSTWSKQPEAREKQKSQQREKYWANIEASRKTNREKMARRLKDPAIHARTLAARRARRALLKQQSSPSNTSG